MRCRRRLREHPPIVVTTLPNDIAPVETTPVHHGVGSGPVVVHWRYKNGAGSTNLIVNPDGTYLYPGTFHVAHPYHDIDVVIGLKNNLGGAYVFQYSGDIGVIPRGGFQWSKQGKSAVLTDDFKNFAARHDWIGSYQFYLTKAGLQYEYDVCKYYATLISQGNGAAAYAAPSYCTTFAFFGGTP